MTLELKLLGGLSICEDGKDLAEWKSQKGLALLSYLAVSGKRCSRSALASLFWADLSESNALVNLRQLLTRMKPVFPYLEVTRQSLAFLRTATCRVDVIEFEANSASLSDIPSLQKAAACYQEDLLDGFYLPDALLYEEWVLAQRAHLRQLAIDVLGVLITHFAGLGANERAIQYARQLLTIEPWHEETHRELMRLLVVAGQRSAALVQYEACRQLLADELGVEPSSTTSQLYEQIKVLHEEAAGPEDLTLSSSTAASPLSNLPAEMTPFIGRETELAALSRYLADPKVRLVTILGSGGMGKTRLALAAAEAFLEGEAASGFFPQGIFFISLARLETPEFIVPAIADALEFRFTETDDVKGQLFRFLRQKKLLLILDNFEHLQAGAILLDEMLASVPGVKLLVTSREKLNLLAEQIFPIIGMTYPAADWKDNFRPNLTGYSAVQLFCDRGQRVQPEFTLTADTQPFVVAICQMVQGMPLGIVLASAWVNTLSPQEIAGEMRNNLDFLESTLRDVPERQRSLRAAFNHSWRLLSAAERVVFQQLSIFRGGFTRHAAQVICEASLRHLQSLVNKSLLVFTPQGRYEIHELLRQFAAEKLSESIELMESVRDRHNNYYCDFLNHHTPHFDSAVGWERAIQGLVR